MKKKLTNVKLDVIKPKDVVKKPHTTTLDLSPEAVMSRARQAASMRISGYSKPDIMEACGFAGITSVDKAIAKGMQLVDDPDPAIIRKLEIQRLDKYLKSLDKRIEDGDIKAIEAALKVQARRSSLLGLDVPVRREVDIRQITAQKVEVKLSMDAERAKAVAAILSEHDALKSLFTADDMQEACQVITDGADDNNK